MNIQVKDSIGFSADDIVKLLSSFLNNRKPKEGSFDYGLETHGAIGLVNGIKLNYPIEVYQSNKSPLVITIQRHGPIF